MTKVRPAEIRFYLDADVLGLARVLVQVRSDVTFPGDPGGVVHKRERPPCPVTTPAVRDEAKSTFRQLEIMMSRWRDIEGSLDRPGPFIYAATRPRLREIPLT